MARPRRSYKKSRRKSRRRLRGGSNIPEVDELSRYTILTQSEDFIKLYTNDHESRDISDLPLDQYYRLTNLNKIELDFDNELHSRPNLLQYIPQKKYNLIRMWYMYNFVSLPNLKATTISVEVVRQGLGNYLYDLQQIETSECKNLFIGTLVGELGSYEPFVRQLHRFGVRQLSIDAFRRPDGRLNNTNTMIFMLRNRLRGAYNYDPDENIFTRV
jgi:hypothetical protein